MLVGATRAWKNAGWLPVTNERRPHRSLDGQTPDATYFASLAAAKRPAA